MQVKLPLLIAVLCLASLHPASASSAQPDDVAAGSIDGIVVDAGGRPVADVTVYANPVELRPGSTIIPTSKTDRLGRFSLLSVRAGVATLETEKAADGYPNTHYDAFRIDDAQSPTVIVVAHQRSDGIVVRLRPPVGVLYPEIVDEQGHPVVGASFRVIREEMPEAYVSMALDLQGKGVLALPPVPFTVVVTAPGFLEWRSDDADSVPEHHVTLRTNERRPLKIVLHRLAAP